MSVNTVNTEPEVSLLHMPSSVIVCLERVELWSGQIYFPDPKWTSENKQNDTIHATVSEDWKWLSDCCLTPIQQFPSCIMAKTN